MKIIFAGRDNRFNRRLAMELAQEHEVCCCLWLEPGVHGARQLAQRFRARAVKYGLRQMLGELAFHAFDRFWLRRHEAAFRRTKPAWFVDRISLPFACHEVHNIHEPQWLELVAAQQPDMIFSVCSNILFKPELYNIPKLGTFVLHEGLTPEYKGLHTTLWALAKGEHQYLGYTVFKVNSRLDAGDILVQGRYNLKPGEGCRNWSWVGHNACIEGLGDIRAALKKLEQDRGFVPLDIAGRQAGLYSWMSLQAFIRLYRKRKRNR